MVRTTLIIVAIIAVACQRRDQPEGTGEESQRQSATEITKTGADDLPTTGELGGSEADRRITQEVRQALVGREGSSVGEGNLTVITVDRVVTLRGSVTSEQERAMLERIAQGVAGVRRIDNQVEIAGQALQQGTQQQQGSQQQQGTQGQQNPQGSQQATPGQQGRQSPQGSPRQQGMQGQSGSQGRQSPQGSQEPTQQDGQNQQRPQGSPRQQGMQGQSGSQGSGR